MRRGEQSGNVAVCSRHERRGYIVLNGKELSGKGGLANVRQEGGIIADLAAASEADVLKSAQEFGAREKS